MFKGSDGGLHERREERDEQIMVSLCLRGHAMLRRTRRALPRSDHAGRRRQPSAKGFVQSPSTSSSTTHPRPFHTFTAVGLQLLLSAQHAAHHSYCISPQAEMRTPAAPFVPEPVLFQSALPSLHVAWRRNRCQAQANHSFTVDRPLSTRACVSLLLVLSIFQISILACVISCV